MNGMLKKKKKMGRKSGWYAVFFFKSVIKFSVEYFCSSIEKRLPFQSSNQFVLKNHKTGV